MKIHSVEICNYKSIGDSDNKIILDPAVTAIIGKNESGKSNVLYSLRTIKFLSKDKDVFKEINQNRNSGAAISFKVVLKSDGDIGLPDEETTVYISENEFSVQGGLLSCFNSEISKDTKTFTEYIESNFTKFKSIDKTELRKNCNNLNVDNALDVPLINETINQFKKWENNVESSIKDEYIKLINIVKQKWDNLTSFLPDIFYRDENRTLKSRYTSDDINNEFKTTNNSFLREFFKFLEFTPDDIKKVTGANNTEPQIQDIKEKIQKTIDKKINDTFKDFYSTEKIILNVEFQQNTISFYVKSKDGATMGLSERSDGLRWYLNMFIDAQMHSLSNRNVVYLFDEPGIHLHVNAQKELLKLFDDLASKGNQVVYTTHSPYMLNVDTEGIDRIRAVEKDKTGNTIIYNKPYSADFVKTSRKDTLTPIIYALGMNLTDTFGPALNKINVVTEGVSDSIYLKAIGTLLKLDFDKYAIVSAVGASNIKDICAILNGWGCKFVALYDYDKEGVEAGKVLSKKYELKRDKHFIYVKDVTDDDLKMQHMIKLKKLL